MNVKLKVISTAVVFFAGQALLAQKQGDTLKEKEIEEVVVVGYSKVNRQTFTGTASTVNQESVDRKSVSTVSQALAGESAGVRVINTSGQPGTDATIRIRGFGSLSGNRSPLYVVDGAPFTGNISSINPDDIANLTILKDATATAIYGSRGANGVVVITTKRGSGNRSDIQIESKVGFNYRGLPQYETISSPEEYVGLGWEGFYNQALLTPAQANNAVGFANSNIFSNSGIRADFNLWGVPASQLIDPATKQIRPGFGRRYNPEDWKDYAFQTSIRTENNLSISGGQGKTTYYTGLGYLKDEGYSINSNYERYTGRFNVTHQVKPWLKGEMNIGYSFSKSKQGGQTSDSGSIFWFTDNIPSIYPLFLRDANGQKIADPYFGGYQYDYGENGRGFGGLTNAIADAIYNKDQTRRHEFNGNVFFDATIVDGLHFETRLAGQYYNSGRDLLRNKYYGSAVSLLGSIYKEKTELFSWNFLQLLRYNKRFSNHGLEAFVAHESNSWERQYLYGNKAGLLTDHIPEWNNGITQNPTGSYTDDYYLESYFGQVNYDYDGKYLVSLTGRRDGSSRFKHAGDKWDNFYSVGLGWVVSRESFLSNVNSISNLKLKTSYGRTGDQAGVGFYDSFNRYEGGSAMGLPGAVFIRTSYDNITWESANQFQVGAEFSLLKSKVIDVTVDYYNKKTNNLFFDVRLAPSVGEAITKRNDGELVNKGFEFNINTKIINKQDYYLTFGVNGSMFKSELEKMPFDVSTGQRKIIDVSESSFGRAAGYSIFDYYMREYAGVNPTTGAAQWTVHYVDTNGNGAYDATEAIGSLFEYQTNNPGADIKTATTEVYAQATQKFLGKTALPDIQGAFNLNFGAKGFFAGAQMLYSLGGYSYDSAYAALMHNGVPGNNNWHVDIRDRWQNPGDVTNVPRLTANRSGDQNYNSMSSRFLTKSDYLVLNNVTFGYKVPKQFLQTMGISNLQLSVNGDNLWIGTKRKGFNPSTNETGASNTYRYTPMSTVTFAAKFNF